MAEEQAAPFDLRVTPARTDLAAAHLAGKLEAARFVEGRTCEVVEPQAPVRSAPSPEAPLVTEALKGERAVIYETNEEGWAWGQLASDGYVGFMPASALQPSGPAPTHRVAALRTLVFPAASIKLPPLESLAFGCRLAIVRSEGPWAVSAAGGFLPARHLVPVETREDDFVAVAERFLGTPYLWGGKSSLGIDCSGLVQVALSACGSRCPRDSDMQEKVLGNALAPASPVTELRRGDLLFWKGHVAVARDRATLLHANTFHMAVAVEPLAEAIDRIRACGSEITSMRRIAGAA
jgi:cell wall-associated NlpC family hydrolase